MALFRGERLLRRVTRRGKRDRILLQFHKAGPSAVYAGLVHYARVKHHRPGSVNHSFKEIFGQEPRPQDRHADPSAVPRFLIGLIWEWAANHKRKPPPRRARRAPVQEAKGLGH